MKILDRLRRRRLYRLQFFMRSGQTFIVDRVSEYEFEGSGGSIKRLSLTQDPAEKGTKLIVASIDLKAIEAVVSLPR